MGYTCVFPLRSRRAPFHFSQLSWCPLYYEQGLQCVDLVYEELQRVSFECERCVVGVVGGPLGSVHASRLVGPCVLLVGSSLLRRFGVLRDKVIDTVQVLLRRTLAPTYTYAAAGTQHALSCSVRCVLSTCLTLR